MYLDWSNDEWEKFYLFAMDCIETFLHFGLEEPLFNVGERTLKLNASPSFIDFISKSIRVGSRYNKKKVFEFFLTKFPKHPSIEQNTFTRWLKLYANAYGMELSETHSGDDNFFELTINK